VTELPSDIAINAWTGSGTAHGRIAERADRWGARGGLPRPQEPLDLGTPTDPKRWSCPDVGYGVVLREDLDVPASDRAAGRDAPEPVRELLAARPGTVMLRYDPTMPKGKIRRYFPDGTTQSPDIGLSTFGTGAGRLPRYVLIIGGPDAVPWSVQYEFGTRHAVGRLPLTGTDLGTYIQALLDGWPGTDLDVRAPTMWTVDLPGDITAQMRAVIANPLEVRLTDPKLPRFAHLAGPSATGPALFARLAAARSALLVTSSHGSTEGDGRQMAATLGLPVDQNHITVTLDALDAAMPAGAIWYSQACCSAGSEGPSKYLGLLGEGSSVAASVAAVAGLGSTVAPAVLRLLGRPHPVRAVLGHVEPTFDWTLRDADTGQGLGHDIVAALSTNLHDGQPLGYAFADYRSGVGELHTDWVESFEQLSAGDVSQRARLTRLRLTAMDRQSLVLLGDPTVTLPTLDGAP
jgi:hypothetical protein